MIPNTALFRYQGGGGGMVKNNQVERFTPVNLWKIYETGTVDYHLPRYQFFKEFRLVKSFPLFIFVFWFIQLFFPYHKNYSVCFGVPYRVGEKINRSSKSVDTGSWNPPVDVILSFRITDDWVPNRAPILYRWVRLHRKMFTFDLFSRLTLHTQTLQEHYGTRRNLE